MGQRDKTIIDLWPHPHFQWTLEPNASILKRRIQKNWTIQFFTVIRFGNEICIDREFTPILYINDFIK